MKVAILAGSTTKFGELWNSSPKDLVREAVKNALEKTSLKLADIDALFVGNMLSGILGNQENLGAFYASSLNINCPAFKIEGACASGGLAFYNAVLAVMSNQFKNVLVVGVEKMTDHKPEFISTGLMAAGSEKERQSGITFPGLYALLAWAHMQKYKTTEEQMAAVAVKNHYHASLNDKAHFKNIISIEKVMQSAKIADPLKLLDCSPISDGAAAVIVSSEQMISKAKHPILIKGMGVATDYINLTDRKDLTCLDATSKAAKIAFGQAQCLPSDINVAEVHDCFTIAEIMAMEDIGFYEKGKAAGQIYKKATTLGHGNLTVNTSGGLKASGHPVGATGIKQIVEITDQLQGNADKRQVEKAKIGLTHNVGGSGAIAVVGIYSV